MQTAKHRTNYIDIFFQLTKRHMLVLFRNKIRMFFTVIAPLIIFAVYILFLRNLELDSVQSAIMQINNQQGHHLEYADYRKSIETVVDSWMLSGIIAISTITVSLQTNNIIVNDKENGVNRDFASSPVSRGVLITSYFLYNFIVTVFICCIFLIVCFIYLACLGEFVLTFADILQILGILLYSSISSVLFTVFICSFIKRDATMGSVIMIFSTAVGFIMGAYMPLGMMPDWVGDICCFFPGTYTCSMLRYSFMATPINDMLAKLVNVPGGTDLLSSVTESFGYNLNFFGYSVDPAYQSLALAFFSLILIVINIFSAGHMIKVSGVLKRKKKRK